MQGTPLRDDVEERLVRWGSEQDVVRDIRPFATDRRWIANFGDVLVAYWDPFQPDPDYGLDYLGNVTWYADRPRIDFTVWPVALLERIAAAPALPAELDSGYRVLLDKDGLTAHLRAPTYAAYVPIPPDEAAYLATVNDFFVDAPAVAVSLLRDDLLPARWVLDCDMTHGYLLRMLQWRMEGDHGWAEPARVLGKGLHKRLPADVWSELQDISAGAATADIWRHCSECWPSSGGWCATWATNWGTPTLTSLTSASRPTCGGCEGNAPARHALPEMARVAR